MKLEAYGVSVDLPSGWDARLYARPLVEPAAVPGETGWPFFVSPSAEGGTASLHAASFPLPAEDGDFGTTATSNMPPDGVFISLFEYQRGQGLEAGQGLFAPKGFPHPLGRADLSPSSLLRMLPGQVGAQHFFTRGHRPFCLYVVLGTAGSLDRGLGQLNQALASLRIEAKLPG